MNVGNAHIRLSDYVPIAGHVLPQRQSSLLTGVLRHDFIVDGHRARASQMTMHQTVPVSHVALHNRNTVFPEQKLRCASLLKAAMLATMVAPLPARWPF